MVETSNQKQSFPLCVHLVKYIDGVVLAHRDKQAENNTERRQRWKKKDRKIERNETDRKIEQKEKDRKIERKKKIVTMSTSIDLLHYL